MHVFTKLEFGEYVFLLLSRKIEISYKVKTAGRTLRLPAVSFFLSAVNGPYPVCQDLFQNLLIFLVVVFSNSVSLTIRL